MARALLAGLAGATRRLPAVLLVWMVGAVFGLAFTIACGFWLDDALDRSLALRTLLKELDVNVFIDLGLHHRGSFTMLLVVGGVLAAAHLVLAIWVNAGVVGTAQDPLAPVRLREIWQRGFKLYPVFARLWLLAMAVDAVVLVPVVAGAWYTLRWISESSSEMSYYCVVGTAVLLAGLLLVMLVAVHDHARIYAARKNVTAVGSYFWALWFVVKGDLRALPLAALLVIAGSVTWLAYQMAASLMPVDSGSGVAMSLLWGEVFLVARAFLRVVTFVAETDLQVEMPD